MQALERGLARLGERPWIFLTALCLFRVLLLLAALDPAEERVADVFDGANLRWAHGPERPLYDREELYAATAAEAIRLHLPLPLESYRFFAYGSGSLVVALLGVPLYTLFGPNYLAWKLIALLVTLTGGLAYWSLCRSWLGTRAAGLFALVYLFAPSTFVRTTSIAKGDHAEAMAWIGCVLVAATRVALGPETTRLRYALGTGALAAFGLFLTYSCLPVLAGIGLVAAVRTRLRPLSLWGAVSIGALVGGIPWLWTLVSTRGGALRIYGQSLGALPAMDAIAERLTILFNQGLFAGYDLAGGALIRTLAALFWLAVVAFGLFSAVRALRRAEGPGMPKVAIGCLLAGIAAHLAAFVLRAPDASSRYLVPGYPLFLVAAILPALHPSRRGQALSLGAILLGASAQLFVVARSPYVPLRTPLHGADWRLFGEVLGTKLTPEQTAMLPDAVRPFVWCGIGRRVAAEVPPTRWPEVLAASGADSLAVWRGIGLQWLELARFDQAAATLRTLSPEARAAALEGFIYYGESLWSGICVAGGSAALTRISEPFAPAETSALRQSMAGTLATLAVHGATSVERSSLSRWSDEELARGVGYARYRRVGSDGIVTWRAAPGSWTDRFDVSGAGAGDVAGGVARGVARGLAYGFERDLGTRSPWSLVDPDRGAPALAAELARLTRGLSTDDAAAFAAAAERATRFAERDPSVVARRGAGVRTSRSSRRDSTTAP